MSERDSESDGVSVGVCMGFHRRGAKVSQRLSAETLRLRASAVKHTLAHSLTLTLIIKHIPARD